MIQNAQLAATYRLISELFLHPAERDQAVVKQYLEIVRRGSAAVLAPIERFLDEPASHSESEYVQTVELAPPCPLYMGVYLFEEPDTCHGAGLSDRNGYLIELVNVYKHFGVEMASKELSDFIPVMVDFLGVSLEKPELDEIGLRRWFLENQFMPGMAALTAALTKYESPYALLVESLDAAFIEDVEIMADQPKWEPPDKDMLREERRLTQ